MVLENFLGCTHRKFRSFTTLTYDTHQPPHINPHTMHQQARKQIITKVDSPPSSSSSYSEALQCRVTNIKWWLLMCGDGMAVVGYCYLAAVHLARGSNFPKISL